MPAENQHKANRMKKVLIITYYWPPSGGPGVQRCVKWAKYLPNYGFEPIIVTVDPEKASYPLIDESLINELSSSIQVFKTRTFEPFNLYTKIIPGANIPKPGFADESNPGLSKKIARFIRGNLFIPDARIGWNRFALNQCRKLIKKEKIAIILASSPPHSTQLIAMQLSREYGIPWIADLRDPWTDIYYNRNLFRLSFARRNDARFEKMVLENADRLITVSDSLKKLFQSKSNKIDPDTIHVIPNGFDNNDFPEQSVDSDQCFSITYTGTMSDDYPIIPFIKSVEFILLKNPSLEFKINMVGQISDKIINLFKTSRISQFLNIQGYLIHSESINLIRKASALLLIIPDVSRNEGIITGKLFEYLAARRPIICFGPIHGDASKIIARCSSGKAFDYNESEKAAKWLLDLHKQWSMGSKLIVGNEHIGDYSRQKQTQTLGHILKSLLKNPEVPKT
jgi:glycosyltransferase involved in cell wall biosynthesis